MYNITKFPIVIVSGTRTGSTVLTHEIREELENQGKSVHIFNEPMGTHEENDFLSFTNDNYILKAHAHDLIKKYPQHFIDKIYNHEFFLIRIRRRNFEDQVLSHYIARTKNVWGYYKDFVNTEQIKQAEEYIPISSLSAIKQDIKYIISSIKNENEILDNFSAKFDLDLFYEDINIKSTYMIKTPKPRNYHVIKSIIREIL